MTQRSGRPTLDWPYQSILARLVQAMAATALSVIFSAPALGQAVDGQIVEPDSRITFGFESDLASRYIWRGFAWSPGAVSQNSAWVSRGNLSGSIWSNYDFAAEAQEPSINEFDFSLAYATTLRKWQIQTSVATYLYPHQLDSPSTTEISLNLSYDLKRLQPFMIHSFDIDEYRGAYFVELGLSSDWQFGERMSAETAVEIGCATAKFNDAYVGDLRAALNFASCESSVTWDFANFLYLRPHMSLSRILDRNIAADVEEPTLFQVGLVLGGEL